MHSSEEPGCVLDPPPAPFRVGRLVGLRRTSRGTASRRLPNGVVTVGDPGQIEEQVSEGVRGREAVGKRAGGRLGTTTAGGCADWPGAARQPGEHQGDGPGIEHCLETLVCRKVFEDVPIRSPSGIEPPVRRRRSPGASLRVVNGGGTHPP